MKNEENSEIEFLKELSPVLFEKKIAVDANPPEGYFDTLGEKITSKIRQDDSVKTGSEFSIGRFINFRNLALAAGVAVILALVPFFRSNTIDTAQLTELAINPEIEIAEISEYIDESDLYDVFESDEISNFSISENLNDDEIINYLIREDFSEQLLLEMR